MAVPVPIPNLTPLSSSSSAVKPVVIFTTPPNYAARLSDLLTLKGHTPLWCPTITTHSTPQSLTPHLSPHSISLLSAIAFPSRASITSFSLAAVSLPRPLLPSHGSTLILAALGKDSELIDTQFMSQICSNLQRIKVLVPPTATPNSLALSLGEGYGRRVLCPVPKVVGINEPPVVPDFLKDLDGGGWIPIRVDAYETRWVGPNCAEEVVRKAEQSEGEVDAIVFTSTGEVEGFLKSLSEFSWDWGMVRKRWPRLLVAAHGPVTAAGAESLGVDVDVVSPNFGSFQGVVDALDAHFRILVQE
ncbi:Tetrapyrrole biosynthesis, uroporphyrinogen III synthase [Corchorus olitorius]|uniref:Tetrapyrrole biosynthesis, uroporphyrinogen III synthase n=1 Tax=Corchorus olitorius TaxID=93759 RepID=A0A1R3IPC6_9ROSI|nr:Tetrapyrrole biosynthesis, uroporphyrinogen III synthase [Corchorus olitorius]